MTEIPNISSYGNYESSNYGMNTIRLGLSSITLYYSYKTIVAYSDFTDGLTVCDNVWSTTTGKHLNWIDDDHSIRLPFEQFEIKLQAALDR
ncbi:unnamed protein product [marine sediment metagenome]|uniref:DUF8033 domain-containing protein n=1 Tax=marine sediment metagenome TaxID=412755 RepID=X0WIT2_9ZZZZ